MSDTFTWGSGGNKLTPNDRRRRMAEAMLKAGSDYSPVQHWTQGLARLANALIGGYQLRQADDVDRAGAAATAADFGMLSSALAGTGANPSSGSAPSFAGGGATRTMAMPNVAPEVKTGIADAAGALGVSPVDLATAISYETGGSFNPTQAGPTTKWGQHRGLIQFGEPQARQYGVDWSNPVGSQLGANGAVVAYLRDRGVRPGMGLMDIYSTINAGAPGLYDRSDAAAGGAPGTVADKVNSQMAGHRAKAQRLFADMPASGAAPASMETGQDGFAVPPAPGPAMSGATFNAISSGQPLDPVFTTEGISQPWMGTALAPAAPSAPQMVQAPLPPARPNDLADIPAQGAVPAMGQVAPAAAPVIVDPNSPDGGMRALIAAEAQGGNSPFSGIAQALMGGGSQAAAVGGKSVFTGLANALAGSSPNATTAASPAVQRVAQAVTGDTAQPSVATSPGGDRVAAAMRVLNSPYAQPGQRAVAQMVVQQAFRDPAKAEADKLDLDLKRKQLSKSDDPTSIQEYNLAKSQGETRNFTDWKAAQARAGATNVNVGGGSDKQFFDTVKESADAARTAATGLNALREARRAVSAGGYFGAGADTKLGLAKLAQTLGIGDADKIVNTETFRSAIAPQVAAIMKATVGSTQISNSDREFAEKAAGGSITLDEKTITRLLDIMERGSMAAIERHQGILDRVYPDDGRYGRERAVFGVQTPAAAPPAAAPERAALEAEARRRGLIK